MAKYRALFVEESREHVTQLSQLLVALETANPAGPVIDEIFRHAHSIKGMAASMGYDPISTLAHRVEDVVDVRRRAGSGSVDRVAVDCLLRAVDALSAQVEAIASGSPLPEAIELVRELGSYIGAPSPAPAAPVELISLDLSPVLPAVVLPPAEAPAPQSADTTAVEEVTLVVRIADSASAPAVRAFLVSKRLQERAKILSSEPTLEALRGGHMPERIVRFVLAAPVDMLGVRKAIEGLPDVADVSLAESPAAKPVVAPVQVAPVAPKNGNDKERTGSSSVRVRTDVLDGLIDAVGELFIARERLNNLLGDTGRADVHAALDQLSARIRDLHDQVLAVRMLPMRTLTERYPRLVRDLARTLGKQVEFVVEGDNIELDRAIIDNLDALFVHILRNAIDHGIEEPTRRGEAKKPITGRIRMTAARDRDTVVVEISDDGRGLDAEALRHAAVAKRVISEEAAASLSARECYFLICLPGFSTKSEVSDISGRGVGMDVVRSKIESLGGSLDIDSTRGQSTLFRLRLPLSLAIIPVLLVEVADRIFAVPVAKVVSVREQGNDVIRHAGGTTYISFRHALVPVTNLAHLLQIGEGHVEAEQVVVLEDGRDLSALSVKRIVGYHEVVVKPLGDPLERLEYFSGAAILGDGRAILILDPAKAMRQKAANAA